MRKLVIGLTIQFIFSCIATAQALDFANPSLDAPAEKKSVGDISIGSFANLNLGVLFDIRYIAAGSNAPGAVVHVNELNITGNIGNHISLLAEQLLPTSLLSGSEDQIGDDHGFVYAIFSGIPMLPDGTAIKIGRFRFKWGVDAVLDAPANPIYPLIRKNLGFVSDKGVEIAGFFGPIDYTLGVAEGPEHVEEVVTDSAGQSIGVVDKSVRNNSNPVILRVSSKLSSSKIGLSYFDGMSWAYSNFIEAMPNSSVRARHPGGMADRSRLVYRQHGAIDYSVRWRKFDLALEYSQGLDRSSGAGGLARTKGYFSRVDYTVKPQWLSLQLQYDQYSDGQIHSKDEKSLSAGVQVFIHDQAFVRLGYQYNRIGLTAEDNPGIFDNLGFVQFYLPL